MKIVAMVGSPSVNSINRKLGNFLKEKYADKMEIEFLEIEKLPFHNYDTENNPPELILEMREKIKEADGVLFITPEYNHSVPPVLKNAIDWFSRVEQVLLYKPALIMGASPGRMGTVRAQEHLKDILAGPGTTMHICPNNEVILGGFTKLLDENGKLVDERTIGFIDKAMNRYIEWVEEVNKIKL